MEELTTRTAKIVPRLRKVKKVPGFATCYHFETDKDLQAAHGNLYVAIEVLTAGKQAEQVADLVIDTIGQAYFNGPQDDEQTALDRFEAAVKLANQKLSDYTDAGNASWVGRLSAVVALIDGEEVHITQAGSAEAYLYRGRITSHITADLQPTGMQKPINTFSNIASGTIQSGDRLIIGTPALFHQVGANELRSIVTDNTANGAIQKISERVGEDDDADRIAGIVVEVTTPKLLAMATLPEEPEEVHVGKPDTALGIARTAATPAAKSLAVRSRQIGIKVMEQTRSTVIPITKQAGLAGAAGMRKVLKQRWARRTLAVSLVVFIAFFVWQTQIAGQAKAINKLVDQYQTDFTRYSQAVHTASVDKSSARAELVSVSQDLDALAKDGHRKQLDERLSTRGKAEGDPSSIDGLKQLVLAQIDSVDGIVQTTPTALTDLASVKDAMPVALELAGNKLVMPNSNGAIYTYDLAAKTVQTSGAPANFGTLTAAAASSTGDGVYLLTSEPALWFYKLDDNSLNKQSVTLNDVPKGKSMAGYNGNLYILADDSSQVWKMLKTSAGFSAKSAYFAAGVDISGNAALAVDGSIYLAGPSGIHRYTQGKLDESSASIPDTLKQPVEIRVNGTTVVSRDGKSNRIGTFSAPDNTINYSKQTFLKGVTSLTAIVLDSKGTTLYGLADNKLVSSTLSK